AEIEGRISVAEFLLEKHRKIFTRMSELAAKSVPLDRITLAEELQRRGELESVDGLSYLMSLDAGLPHISNLDAYVGSLLEKSLLRRIAVSSQHVLNRALVGEEDGAEILAGAEEDFLALRTGKASKERFKSPSEILSETGGLNSYSLAIGEGRGVVPTPF